ncbi:hypothetical protein FRAAL0418 [Frankia alni ACN14a]|uniref:Uncharacterized protein n=1 Tax=Frankia alni (strain DSM 45986 / CECT 9034 / ACN14a) TaxID=326424 RepID=Q0RTK5_FRAAA|nr:hypothetical protein FRAAL0418 [Frankia alni ACN14a]
MEHQAGTRGQPRTVAGGVGPDRTRVTRVARVTQVSRVSGVTDVEVPHAVAAFGQQGSEEAEILERDVPNGDRGARHDHSYRIPPWPAPDQRSLGRRPQHRAAHRPGRRAPEGEKPLRLFGPPGRS